LTGDETKIKVSVAEEVGNYYNIVGSGSFEGKERD
jgi:hypothetical protein